MKFLKTYKLFESDNPIEPQIDDFVLCKVEGFYYTISDFIKSNIGRIVDYDYITYQNETIKRYTIEWKNIPSSLASYFFDTKYPYDGFGKMALPINYIKHYSKDINDLLPMIKANKYNI